MQTIFTHDCAPLKLVLDPIVQRSISTDANQWLRGVLLSIEEPAVFNSAFTMMPRRTGKKPIQLSADEVSIIQGIRPSFTIQNWSADRLCRVYLLMHKEMNADYHRSIESLFSGAEMSELVALYAALPILLDPPHWRKQCAEGIRSNIGDVLNAIICDNPYPSEQLDEKAWNQLVLKAFFTEKSIQRIINLDQRANHELAGILSDYAHERWAAGRSVHPQLWRCIAPFVNQMFFADIQKIASSENEAERQAAALVCFKSAYPPAKQLLSTMPDLQDRISRGLINWDSISVS